MAIKLAIASGKGGAGKSTWAIFLANKLFFEKRQKVLIIDCDIPQNSCHDVRDSELKKIKKLKEKIDKIENGESIRITQEEKNLWKFFARSYKEHPSIKEDFKIIIPETVKERHFLDEIVEQIPEYEKMNYDIIIFDTVGTIAPGDTLLSLMQEMDHIFVPIECEDQALKPAIASLSTFLELSENHSKNVFGFINKLKPMEKDQQRCLRGILSIANQMQLPLLYTDSNQPAHACERAVYRRPIVKSTLIPSVYTKEYLESEGNELLEIICNKILK